MADQYIIKAKENIREFERIWRMREHEFNATHMHKEAEEAKMLADEAKKENPRLDRILDKDKVLDKPYDRLKARQAMGLEAYA